MKTRSKWITKRVVYIFALVSLCSIDEFKELNLWAFEDINGKFQGGRVKVVGIQGGLSKFKGKTWISRGVNAKKVKISRGVMIKLTGNPGGSTSK